VGERLPYKQEVAGSIPAIPTTAWGRGAAWLACRSVTPVVASSSLVVPAIAKIAQVVEQWTENPRVPGSTPGLGRSKKQGTLVESPL